MIDEAVENKAINEKQSTKVFTQTKFAYFNYKRNV